MTPMAVRQNGNVRASAEPREYIDAAHVSVGKDPVRVVDADQATLEHAAVRRLRAGHATIAGSNLGVANFERGSISQSNVGVIAGKSIAVDEVRTIVLAAPVVRGEVHTLVDLRTAVALGFGMALGKAVISMLGRVVR